MKKSTTASPLAYPRTGQLYSQRAVPEALRPAFDGKAEHKNALKTKDPAAAKVGFARENAAFEAKLARSSRSRPLLRRGDRQGAADDDSREDERRRGDEA